MKFKNRCTQCDDPILKYCIACNKYFCQVCLNDYHQPQLRKDHLKTQISDVDPNEIAKFRVVEDKLNKFFE